MTLPKTYKQLTAKEFKARKKWLLSLVALGLSQRETARVFGMSHGTYQNQLRKHGVAPSPVPPQLITKLQVVTAFSENKTAAELAESCGVCIDTAYKAFAREGLKPRTPITPVRKREVAVQNLGIAKMSPLEASAQRTRMAAKRLWQ